MRAKARAEPLNAPDPRTSYKFSAVRAPARMIVGILAILGAVAVLKYLSDQGAKEHAGEADRLCAQGRHAEAVRAYGEAIGADPGNARLHSLRGHALRELGRHQEALDDYTRAAELDGGSAAAHCDAADMLMALGRPEGALARARRAVELSPKSARAHRTMGEALWGTGLHDDALEALRMSAGLQETVGLRIRMAEMCCAARNHDGERGMLDRAIHMDRGSADLHYRRARALLHVAGEPGRLEESCCGAIADLEKALEIDPRHEEAREMLRRARSMREAGGPGRG